MRFIINGITKKAADNPDVIEYRAYCPDTKRMYIITFPYGLRNAYMNIFNLVQPELEDVRFRAEQIGNEQESGFMELVSGHDVTLVYSPEAFIKAICLKEKEKIDRINALEESRETATEHEKGARA